MIQIGLGEHLSRRPPASIDLVTRLDDYDTDEESGVVARTNLLTVDDVEPITQQSSNGTTLGVSPAVSPTHRGYVRPPLCSRPYP